VAGGIAMSSLLQGQGVWR